MNGVKEDLVVLVYRSLRPILENALTATRGVEEEVLEILDNVNPVLREDGKTFAYVLVIPYREGPAELYPNGGFLLPALWRLNSANIFTRKGNMIGQVRMKMQKFGAALIGDFIDNFKVHRGRIGISLGVEHRFKKQFDVVRWDASLIHGVPYREVTEAQMRHQRIIALAEKLVDEAACAGITIDQTKMREFIIDNSTDTKESV